MKRLLAGAAALLLALGLSACAAEAKPDAAARDTQPGAAPEPIQEQSVPDEISPEEPAGTGETMIYAHIGDSTLTIRPEDNSSAQAFLALLAEGDVTVSMRDYGGFEKVGELGAALPANDERITTEPGDVILYQGDQITIYYGVNTWRFTRLSKVQELTARELLEVLGEGDAEVRFSLR